MIVGVPAVPITITDPADPRVADFRDLKAGDRPEGTPRWSGPVIVEGVPAVERLLASDYRVRAVFGVPGRVAALGIPDDVAAYEADKWLLSEVIGFRLTRGVLASADRRAPADLDTLLAGPDPQPRAGWPCSRRSTTRRTWARSRARRSRWASTGCSWTRAAPTRSTAARCGSRWATSWRCRSPSCPTGPPTWAGCTTPAT